MSICKEAREEEWRKDGKEGKERRKSEEWGYEAVRYWRESEGKVEERVENLEAGREKWKLRPGKGKVQEEMWGKTLKWKETSQMREKKCKE